MSGRRDKLLAGLDIAALQGAEIGPLTAPLVQKSDGHIIYIDHATTEQLREKYADDPSVDVNRIVNVDAVWGENTIGEALGSGVKVDYIVASHVIEHVPDLVAWLKELTSVLNIGGSVRLAIPDYAFCFDYLRQPSRLSDVLAAHFLHARRPQVREIIDAVVFHQPVDTGAAWAGEVQTSLSVSPGAVQQAFQFAERSVRGEYVDVHCWTFSLSSFATIMAQLNSGGLVSLGCAEVFDTAVGEHEFIAVMSVQSREDAVDSWTRVINEAKGPADSDANTWPLARLEWMRAGASERPLEERLQLIENSASWRITAPLRRWNAALRGLF